MGPVHVIRSSLYSQEVPTLISPISWFAAFLVALETGHGHKVADATARTVAGVAIGHTFGARYEKPATIVGGVVLILIGLKILLDHLGILAL